MIIIRNAQVTFCLDQVRANNVAEFVGTNAYFTKHGWFYPISYYATNLLDVLDGKCKRLEKMHEIQKALLITHDSVIYEYTANREGVVRKRRCLYSPVFIYHRCDTPKEDQMISTTLDVNPVLGDIDILTMVLENSENIRRKLMTVAFSDIIEELHKRFPLTVEKK